VNLTGEVKEFDLNVTLQQKSVVLSPFGPAIIGAMAVAIVVLGILLVKAKK
jgi:hypothetical protein